jgi:uncharacterized protein YciI
MATMHFYHVAITAADDYMTRRAAHRAAHLERIVGLRAQGAVIGGGPAPDGRTADLFYRAPDEEALTRLVEEDPYWKSGVWTAVRPEAFTQFLEPWRVPELSTDGSRLTMLVEGEAPDVEMATFALIQERGAGRVAFGGFFPGGRTLALVNSRDAAEAVSRLAESGLWTAGTLRARPFVHVL